MSEYDEEFEDRVRNLEDKVHTLTTRATVAEALLATFAGMAMMLVPEEQRAKSFTELRAGVITSAKAEDPATATQLVLEAEEQAACLFDKIEEATRRHAQRAR